MSVDFYLGVHKPHWLNHLTDVPAMVSRRRLAAELPRRPSRVPWVLDSGGFSEILKFGRWSVGVEQYVDEIGRFAERLGAPLWCAPQDWMCEPDMIERTGKSVVEHQALTVENFVALSAADTAAPVIPVLQGQTLGDYLDHVNQYLDAGVDLASFDTVGLGSVCRRENTQEIADIVAMLAGLGLRLHGFGCKAGAIRRCGSLLRSADSMAWSKAGRERGPCTHLVSRCANHRHYALEWRERVLAAIP